MIGKHVFTIMALLLMLAAGVVADDLAVTVYNSNLGVVSETRTLLFEKGTGQLQFRDVPALIDPGSVRFEIMSSGRNISILEQNYAYDLVRPQQMFLKYLDQKIELMDDDGRIITGELLSSDSKSVVLKESSGKIKIINLDKISEVNFPALPDGLITRPTLFWLYSSDFSGQAACRVGYQTSGLGWDAEYIGVLNEVEDRIHLSGWASIQNASGKTYEDAKLKLVAGDIQRAQKGPSFELGASDMMVRGGRAGEVSFDEKAFFEYHLYTLPRSATLANNEKKQISLFEPSEADVEKILIYRPDRKADQVDVLVKFRNSNEAGLGMPLPAGRVRIFKADDDGSLILLGEDNIKHTPRDEDIKLTVGTAFDVSASQTLVDQTRLSKQVEERTFEIELRNHKKTDVSVQVEKLLPGDWEIVESSAEYKKKDAYTILFELPVPASGKAKVIFKVRFTYLNR
jgi:hypothetical protein